MELFLPYELLCLSVGSYKGREVTLPSSYRRTCILQRRSEIHQQKDRKKQREVTLLNAMFQRKNWIFLPTKEAFFPRFRISICKEKRKKGAITFWVVHQMDFGLNSLLQYLYRVLQVAFFHSAAYYRMKHFWHRHYAVGYIEFLDAPHLNKSLTDS